MANTGWFIRRAFKGYWRDRGTRAVADLQGAPHKQLSIGEFLPEDVNNAAALSDRARAAVDFRFSSSRKLQLRQLGGSNGIDTHDLIGSKCDNTSRSARSIHISGPDQCLPCPCGTQPEIRPFGDRRLSQVCAGGHRT